MVHRTNNTTDPSQPMTPTGVKGRVGHPTVPLGLELKTEQRINDIQTGLFSMIEANLISHRALMTADSGDTDLSTIQSCNKKASGLRGLMHNNVTLN